jgi:putative ABC transport system permease protein
MEMENALRDGRHALRRLRHSPGFTVAALLTLALGIGANALIFSVVNAVFLRPLSYHDASRLVWATEFFPKFNRSIVPAPDYAAWKQQSLVFDRLEAMSGTFGANLTSTGRPAERVQTAHVSPGFFAMVEILPRMGAGFNPNAAPPDPPVAILSDALWRGYLQADPAIIGKSIGLNGKALTVAGVMPPGFVYPDGGDVAVWLPDAVLPAAAVPSRRPQFVRLIGRLKPGVTIKQARAELESIARGIDHQYPAPWSGYHAAAKVRIASLQKQLTTDSETAAAVLMGAVGFLLLIACANVANLFLARAVTRRKEIAVRTAIGARRRDIVRMLLAESLLLGAMGGSLGIAFLIWGRGAVRFLMPKALPPGIPIDWRVLAFTAGCSLAAGLLFGLVPALAASRVDVNAGLKETAISSGGRLPAFLAAGQIALSLVLLAGAGLMIRSFLILSSVDPGFNTRNVLMATTMLRPSDVYGPERQVEFFDRMLAGIERLPGVRYAAVTSSPPMAQFSALEIGLRADDGPETNEAVALASVSPTYFQTLEIPLVSGRLFDARDRRGGRPVAIVNETLAHTLFQGRNPLGRRINSSVTVVGVVADIRHRALDDKVWPELFFPFEQSPSPWITLLVRGTADPSALAAPIRRVARAIDPGQPLFDVELLERRVSKSLAERRERATVLGAFAALALVIAIVGIYGVMSYSAARRRHEIGVRMALGARRRDVLRMVVGSGLRMAAFGMAIGLAGALLITRVLRTFLYGIGPADRITFCLVCAILGAAAFLASYLPARRAAAVDPMVALRQK